MAGTFVASNPSSLTARLLMLHHTAEWQHHMRFSPESVQNLELEPELLS